MRPNDRKRQNILVLPAWYPSDHNPVMGTFVREHTKAAAKFHNVTVLYASLGRLAKGRIWEVSSDRDEDGIRTVRVHWRDLPTPLTSMLVHMWVLFAASRYLRRTGYQPDVIHAHIFTMAPFAVGLGKLMRVPVVITEQASSFPRGHVKGKMLQVVKLAYRSAAMILPVSSWLQESMQSVGIRGKFRVIPNTVDLGLFFPSSKEVTAEVSHPLPQLLTVGLLTEPKGIPYLLQAIRIVKEHGKRFHLDIVGDGAQRAEYEQLAMELGVQDWVTFHGLKGKSEVAHMMREAAFYLQPSLWETFCVAIIEAMACGKPVIGTQIPVFLEKIGSDMGILVPPSDAEQLAAAIEEMLDSYQEYDGEAISRYVAMRFSQEEVGKMLSDVYDEVRRKR